MIARSRVRTGNRGGADDTGNVSDLWSVTIPGYTTGVATVGLVVVTAITVRGDRVREQRSLDRETRREVAAATRDARKVFAISADPDDPLHGAGPSAVERIMFVNGGDAPIFNVGGGSLPTEDERNSTPFYWEHGIHQLNLSFLLPGQQGFLGGQWMDTSGCHPRGADVVYWMRPQLPVVAYWTDGRGNRWERVRNEEPATIDLAVSPSVPARQSQPESKWRRILGHHGQR